ncbi:MAG: arsenate reductase family protein [Cyclobacteriaceae bacterium]
MQFHPNELFILYDPSTSAGKQAKAMALSICSHLNEVDSIHEKLSPTYWKEIVRMLGLQPDDMLDHSHPDYKAKVASKSYTMNGWLEVLTHYPYLVKGPIAIFNGKAVLCHTPTDILKLETAPKVESKVLPHLKRYHE